MVAAGLQPGKEGGRSVSSKIINIQNRIGEGNYSKNCITILPNRKRNTKLTIQ